MKVSEVHWREREGHTEELVLDIHIVLGIADSLAVRVLDTMLVQNTAAPVVTAAYDLSTHSAHITTRL